MRHFRGHANGFAQRWMRVNRLADVHRVRAHLDSQRYLANHVACVRADDTAANVLTTATQTPSICIFIGYTRKVPMRAAAINLRALPEQRDLIDHAATLLGKNRSDFMLEAACERAQSVLLDQVFFGLDTEKFQQFTALLDAPASANPGLERLMAVKPPWDSQPA